MKLNSRSHKFQFVGELKSNRICHGFVAVAFFFGFSRSIFAIRRFESFDSKKYRKWIYGNLKNQMKKAEEDLNCFPSPC